MKRYLKVNSHFSLDTPTYTPSGNIILSIIFYDDEDLEIEDVDIIMTNEITEYLKGKTWDIRTPEEESEQIEFILNNGRLLSKKYLDSIDVKELEKLYQFNSDEVLNKWGFGKEFKFWENQSKIRLESIKLLKRLKNIQELDL